MRADDPLQVDLQSPLVERFAEYLAARPDLRADHIADAVEIDRIEAESTREIFPCADRAPGGSRARG
jgi:hypothetical protein